MIIIEYIIIEYSRLLSPACLSKCAPIAQPGRYFDMPTNGEMFGSPDSPRSATKDLAIFVIAVLIS